MNGKESKTKSERGGFWGNRHPRQTKDTKELLEVLMAESRLTMLQRQQLRSSILSERCLPLKLTGHRKSGPRCCSSSVHTAKTVATSGLRSIGSIIASGAYNRPRMPSAESSVAGNAIEEKVRLQNLMAFGQAESPSASPPPSPDVREDDGSSSHSDAFDQIAAEISERQRFLEEMRALGLEKKYSLIIDAEISQRVRELQLLTEQEN